VRTALRLSPLLVLYLLVVVASSTDTFRADEGTYAGYALNLTRGYYTDADPMALNLWSGPGYPLALLPFAAVEAPWLAAKLLNAVFLFASVLLFHRTLRFWVAPRSAWVLAALLGVYPPFLRYLGMLMTESLAVLLMCAFAYCLARLYREDAVSKRWLLATALVLAWLALTKIVFGWVILAALLASAALSAWKPRAFRRAVAAYGLALLLCTPYLTYTFGLTGRVFYWGNSGGSSLYWISTPYEGEFGDWHNWRTLTRETQTGRNHLPFFEELAGLPAVDRDRALKAKAIDNIREHPLKFVENWLANVGRLLFNYPYSATPQKPSTYFYWIPNAVLVVLSLLCLYPTWVARRSVPVALYVLGIFGLLGFVASSLLSAYARQLLPLVPLLALWIAYTTSRLVRIELAVRATD
jgi:4-amino-4-deoxy-L-arabinose transferase-like glycosyltransferase